MSYTSDKNEAFIVYTLYYNFHLKHDRQLQPEGHTNTG